MPWIASTAAEVLAAKSGRKTARKVFSAEELFGEEIVYNSPAYMLKRLEKTARAIGKVRVYYVKKRNNLVITRAQKLDKDPEYDDIYISDSYSVVVMPYRTYKHAFPDLPDIETGYTIHRIANSDEWITSQGETVKNAVKMEVARYSDLDAIEFSPTMLEVPAAYREDKKIIVCEDMNGKQFLFNGAVLALMEKLHLPRPVAIRKKFRACGNMPETEVTHVITSTSYPVYMFALGIRNISFD